METRVVAHFLQKKRGGSYSTTSPSPSPLTAGLGMTEQAGWEENSNVHMRPENDESEKKKAARGLRSILVYVLKQPVIGITFVICKTLGAETENDKIAEAKIRPAQRERLKENVHMTRGGG